MKLGPSQHLQMCVCVCRGGQGVSHAQNTLVQPLWELLISETALGPLTICIIKMRGAVERFTFGLVLDLSAA